MNQLMLFVCVFIMKIYYNSVIIFIIDIYNINPYYIYIYIYIYIKYLNHINFYYI